MKTTTIEATTKSTTTSNTTNAATTTTIIINLSPVTKNMPNLDNLDSNYTNSTDPCSLLTWVQQDCNMTNLDSKGQLILTSLVIIMLILFIFFLYKMTKLKRYDTELVQEVDREAIVCHFLRKPGFLKIRVFATWDSQTLIFLNGGSGIMVKTPRGRIFDRLTV